MIAEKFPDTLKLNNLKHAYFVDSTHTVTVNHDMKISNNATMAINGPLMGH